MQQMEIWSVILFLSRETFHAKKVFVLSSSMKLGPDCLQIASQTTLRDFFILQTGQQTTITGTS